MAASLLEPLSTPSDPFQSLLDVLVKERTERIINLLVSDHRNNTISPQEALSAVATISGLRLLVSDLASKTRKVAQIGTV